MYTVDQRLVLLLNLVGIKMRRSVTFLFYQSCGNQDVSRLEISHSWHLNTKIGQNTSWKIQLKRTLDLPPCQGDRRATGIQGFRTFLGELKILKILKNDWLDLI